jgi:hypothetical protein
MNYLVRHVKYLIKCEFIVDFMKFLLKTDLTTPIQSLHGLKTEVIGIKNMKIVRSILI